MSILKHRRLRGSNDSIIELHLFRHPWGCEITVSGGSVDNLQDALALQNTLAEFIGIANGQDLWADSEGKAKEGNRR